MIATLQRKPTASEEENRRHQRKLAGGSAPGPSMAPPIVHEVLRSGGQPLGPKEASYFAPRLGRSFSDVRVHTDAHADASARAVGALAYTVGRDVVFRSGAFAPETEGGRRLLAHELVHVVQQGSSTSDADLQALRVAPADDLGERDADQRAAQAVDAGTAPPSAPPTGAPVALQRRLEVEEAEPEPVAPRVLSAVDNARSTLSTGNILFDSWGNDLRDNDNDGVVDEEDERMEDGEWIEDGSHYAGTYPSFGVVAGTYTGLGWNYDQSLTVPSSATISGSFSYRVCADVVSQAYADAGLMSHMRSTRRILNEFRDRGTVWRESEGFPAEYLPGDFVCTLGRHGGHSGIVVSRSATGSAPTVIELPGPSTQVDAGTYDPASTNDVREGPWSKFGVVSAESQYIGRFRR